MLLVYQYQKYLIQQEIKHALNKNENGFENLTISISDFKKGKINDYEITFKGKMYDFTSVKIIGDYVELIVINDTKEEGILSFLEKTFSNDNNQDNNLPNPLLKLLTLIYISPILDHQFLMIESKQNIFRSTADIFLSYTADIASPPPKTV
jgi:hypothetical protein